MNRQQLPLYAVAQTVLIVGFAFAGVPLGTLVVLPLILVCPLMMFFLMRGMTHGRDHDDYQPVSKSRDGRDRDDDDHATTNR